MHDSDCSTNNRGVPDLLGPCDCRAQVSQAGEAVEVVGYIDANGCLWNGTTHPGRMNPLMTVAQHQRILAAATHPADQVAEDVVVSRELLERVTVPMLGTPEYLFDHRDALDELRSLLANQEGVKS
jgi:hypothetical protein